MYNFGLRDDGWVDVTEHGGEPARVLFGRGADGQLQILGLHIEGRPVTSSVLRGIRLREIVEGWTYWLNHFRNEAALLSDEGVAEHRGRRAGQDVDLSEEHLERLRLAGAESQQEADRLEAALRVLPPPEDGATPRGRGAAAPSDEELQRFASLLLDERRRRPREATRRAAERFPMHISSAYRWLKMERLQQYLPTTEDRS